MAELAQHGLEFRWSSLKGRERTFYFIALGLLATGGFAIGLILGFYGYEAKAPLAVALIPLPFLAAGFIIWARFTKELDELHRRMGGFAARVAYWSTLAVAIPVGLVEGLSGIELLPTWSIAFVTIASGGLGWRIAGKRFMSEPRED